MHATKPRRLRLQSRRENLDGALPHGPRGLIWGFARTAVAFFGGKFAREISTQPSQWDEIIQPRVTTNELFAREIR
jgi:hypothetical protein